MHQTMASIRSYIYENYAALGLPSADRVVFAEKPGSTLTTPCIVMAPAPDTSADEPVYSGYDGAEYVDRFVTLLQFEVVTVSEYWNDAERFADLLHRFLIGRGGSTTIPRRTWLLDTGLPNPAPVVAGEITLRSDARFMPHAPADDPMLKSIFVRADATWSRPRPP